MSTRRNDDGGHKEPNQASNFENAGLVLVALS